MAGTPLSILNAVPKRMDGPELLHDLVPRSSASGNAAIEYASGDGSCERVSYQQLHTRSDALAAKIHRLAGLRQSSNKRLIVPCFMPQSPELYVSQLAILKAGGAFCPVALDTPEERVRFIFQDTEASLVLTVAGSRGILPCLHGLEIVEVDEPLDDPGATNGDPAMRLSVRPSQPAYVMYTSGSTGTPKGVLISHSAATQALLAHDRHIPPFSRFLQFASPTFDVSVFEIFFPLFRGVTLVSCDRRLMLNDLPGVINRVNVDAVELTPSVASSLLSSRNSVPSLKLLLTIGEMLKQSVLEEFGGSGDEAAVLYGMYGPTEATIHCTLYPAAPKTMSVRNIGQPLDTVSAFIIEMSSAKNENAPPEILPVGEEGELAIGGFQLADGYLNRPKQTSAAFFDHPTYGRLYRTGDLCAMTNDGCLECRGRISNGQIKLRGQRIELGEVEYAATRSGSCKTAVADVFNGTLLVFCVRSDPSVTATDVSTTCKRWLPAFMVPEVVMIESLPYLPSGKVDRKTLCQYYTGSKQEISASGPASGASRNHILQVIEKSLDIALDKRLPLSAVGLDSLSAIRIASQLRRDGYPQLDASDILEARTVDEIERLVHLKREQERDRHGTQTPMHQQLLHDVLSCSQLREARDTIEDLYPCTPMQAAMFAETRKSPELYCNWIKFEASHTDDVRQVFHAIEEVAKCHALLRAGFVMANSGPAVVVWKVLAEEQIKVVPDFNYDFSLQNEVDYLRPTSFQLRKTSGMTHILLKIHHALYDQWSIDMLKQDLSLLLARKAVDRCPRFSSISSFYDKNVAKARSAEVVEFWQENLLHYTITQMPNLNGRSVVGERRRSSCEKLQFDITCARQDAGRLGYSLPSVFQAAFAWILASYVGSTDIVYGTVVSGRHLPVPDIERVFGPCLLTLPCRIDISTVRTCLDLMRLTHARTRAMQRHALTPLTEIKRASGCPPEIPLFDTLFVWQESTVSRHNTEHFVSEIDSADHNQFNVVLEVEPVIDGVRIRVTHQERLLSVKQVSIMLQQLSCVAEHMLSCPNDVLAAVNESLSLDLLSMSNPQPSPSPASVDLTTAIEKQAQMHPHATAIVFAPVIKTKASQMQVLSYKELNKRANKLAHFILSLGVRIDSLVGICMEKSLDLYISVLAVIKAGAGYLPLNPETPKSRLKHILTEARVDITLCDHRSAQILQDVSNTTVVDISVINLTMQRAEAPKVVAEGSSVAYTVYTSGSTGTPKGVMVTRDNLSANLAVLTDLYKVQPGNRLLQACSQAFDVSVFEIFFAFSTGMCLCSAAKEQMFHDIELSIRELEITHLSLTPTVAALIDPDKVPGVQFLVTSGEGVTESVRSRWAGRGLHQGYGPSETTNIVSLNMNMQQDDVLGNIGKPFANTSAFVISPEGEFRLLPAGGLGELVLGGEQVFRGYLGREDLNADKLILHPSYGRLYRSGDLGRILDDGSLLITGRIDDQVKIRGNRVELGEVNAAILRDPDVLDCASLVETHTNAEQRLLAFFIPRNLDVEQSEMVALARCNISLSSRLFALLESTLPSYMIPDLIVPITQMPLTTQGKLDKRLLKSLVSGIDHLDPYTRTPFDSEPEREWSYDERVLAEAFADTMLIPLANVEQSKSFFALGLNSLNAIRFARAAEMRLRKPVTTGKVLRHYSIRRLAAAVAVDSPTPQPRQENTAKSVLDVFYPDTLAKIEAHCVSNGLELEKVLPCTPLQDVMLSTSTTSGSDAYTNSLTFKIHGHMSRLKECWSILIKRHEILRTHFIRTDSRNHPYAQVVLKQLPLPWQEMSQARLNKHDDLNSSPNLTRPFKLQSTTYGGYEALVIHMHHAIYDGVTMSILLKEVEQIYLGESLPPPPSNLPLLKEYQSHSSTAGVQFWAAKFHDYQPKPLPIISSASRSERTVKYRLTGFQSKIEAFCQQRSITPLIIFQAAWAKTLSCAQCESDICFGNVVSGRSSMVDDLQRVVFPCFNTIPVRVDLRRDQSNLQLLMHLRSYNSETVDFQYTPLRHIQKCSTKPQLHLFDTMLLLQPESEKPNSKIWTKSSERGSMGEPIVMEVIPEDNDYMLSLHYEWKYLDPALARRLMEAFRASLADIVSYPSGSVSYFQGFDTHNIAAVWQSHHDLRQEDAHDATGVDRVNEEDWNCAETDVRVVFAAQSHVKIDDIRKTTTMYRLGLDSLNAPQIAAALRARGYNLMATDIIECQTPAAIASRSVRLNGANGPTTVFDLSAFDKHFRASIVQSDDFADEDVEAVRPCTPAQIGMIAQSLETDGKLYINHITHEVPDGVSYNDISQAWKTVQAVHPMLRVGFFKTDDTKHPFVMAVRKIGSATSSVDELNDCQNSNNEELALAKHISRQMRKIAWSVSVFSSKRPLRMTLSIHHALYDAESLRFIFNDFAQALFTNCQPTPLSVDHLLSATLNESRETHKSTLFWKSVMQNDRYPKFPDLSSDVGHAVGKISSQHICKISASSLEDYCKQASVTIQAVGQAIWSKLLCSYTAEPNIVFGTVFSTRSNAEHERTAFPAIYTVPVFCKAQNSLDDQVQAMFDYNTKAYGHRGTPLTDIKRLSGAFKGQLFDTIFVFQKEFDDVHHRLQWPLLRETSNVDYVVSLEMELSSSNHINLQLHADGAKVPHAHAKLILEQYDHLLSEFVAPVRSSKAEVSSLYSIVPAKQSCLPSTTRLLHEFVQNRAKMHPDKAALYFVHGLDCKEIQESCWSYKQLDERGNQIAQLLYHHGVKSNEVVAVRMHKCPEASFAFLGILKAGCAFLALDPNLPEARQKFILNDSSARLLLVDRTPAWNVESNISTIIATENALMSYSTNPVNKCNLEPSALCYCLYTSGSTGTPKGCEITHENAVQAMLAFQKLFDGHWDHHSRWLQFASYWFDVSILEQFWSWSVGIALVGAPRDLVLQDLAGFIQSMEITHIDLTPSLARLLHPNDVPSLHQGVFITGGEALKQEIIDVWGPYNVICNGYGPTEATIGVTMNPFIGKDARPSNIGKQFDNVGSYVLAPESEEPVLRGAVGELCVSGKLVGKGYLNQPELTTKAFPYLEKFNERVYRTGDLCRLLADGSFNFIGRKDTQAKLRGQRLEVSEIDAVIAESGGQGLDVASMVIKADENREQLVAFVTANGAKLGSSLELDLAESSQQLVTAARQACKDQLPGYMVPTHIVPLRSLPLTVNNKLDNKAMVAFFKSLDLHVLQSLDENGSGSSHWTRTERRVQSLLSKMLNVAKDSINRNSNIFSLGLSSVTAISFSSLLKREGFSRAHVAVVMKNATISSLASALATKTSSTSADGVVEQARLSMQAFAHQHCSTIAERLSIHAEEIESITPCTPLQEGLIFDSLSHPERPYFNQFRYTLMVNDLTRLQEAFQLATNSIELLRSRFLTTDEGFAQVVMKKAKLPWFFLSLVDQECDLVLANQRTSWLSRNEGQLLEPMRISILSTEEATVIAIFAHHALYDGISWQYVLEHVEQAYMSLQAPDCGPAFTFALPYGPLQRRTSAEGFWREKLDGIRFQPLPSVSNTEITNSVKIDAQIAHETQVEGVRKLLGVTHQAVLQACFEVTVRHHFPATQTYGQIVSGRSIELLEAERVTGPLFNTLPLAVNIDPATSWAEHISQINDKNIASLPFQHTALRDIRRWCGMNPSEPMFDVLFAFQHESTYRKSQLFKAIAQMPQAEYPLAFEVNLNTDGAFEIFIIAQRWVADRPLLDALVQTFQMALHAAIASPNAAVGERFELRTVRTIHQNSGSDKRETQQSEIRVFEWSEESSTLRSMIAKIAGVHVEKVNEKSTVFSLGLDSIDAVKLSSRAKAAGIILPVSKIIKAQTIPSMLDGLEVVQRQECADDNNETLRIVQSQLVQALKPMLDEENQIERLLPATPNQEALIAAMLRANWQEYYNHDILRVQEYVDIAKLEASWQDVINQNPILRTGFVPVDNPELDITFAQVIHRPRLVKVQEVIIESFDVMDRICGSIADDIKANYRGQPLLRLTKVLMDSDRYMVLSLAHALYDGHSLALIHNDVRRAYYNCHLERPSYDLLVQDALRAKVDRAKSFWRSTMSGASPSPLPVSFDTHAVNTNRMEMTLKVTTPEARGFCRKHRVSMQALSQCCWALLLSYYTCCLEVVFGIVLACRDSEDAEQVMFPTMNTVPMRVTLHGTKMEMVQYMQNLVSNMREYQHTPLRQIQAACADTLIAPRSGTIFDSLFIYQRRLTQENSEDIPLYESVGSTSNVEYPIAAEIEAVGNDLIVRVACKGNVLDNEGTKQLLDQFDQLLCSILDTPDAPTITFQEDNVIICDLLKVRLADSLGNDERINSDVSKSEDQTDFENLPIARCIRQVLAKVSKVPSKNISSLATIESIGIDSISAIKVATILRRQSINLSVSDILRTRNIGELAKIAANNLDRLTLPVKSSEDIVRTALEEHNLHSVSNAQIGQDNIEKILPATAGQVYMLNLWQHSEGQLFYPTFTYHIQGDTNPQQIRQAWDKLVASRPILRTILLATGSGSIPVVQVVLKNSLHSFESDFHSNSATHAPVTLLEISREKNTYVLKLKIHHVFYDAISLPLLIKDLRTLVAGGELESPSIRYEDFIALSVTNEARSSMRAFWTSYLMNARPLPTMQRGGKGAKKKVEILRPRLLGNECTLEATAKKNSTTVQALFFAAFAKVYATFVTGREANVEHEAADAILGVYLANRAHLANLGELRAPTVNLVPLLIRSPIKGSLVQLAKQIQTDLREIRMAQNSTAALWEIAQWTGVRVQSFVNFLKLPEQDEEHDKPLGDIRIVDANESKLEGYGRIVEPPKTHFKLPVGFEMMQSSNAYGDSLDIEATLITGGGLTVGLFCPEEMLSLPEAQGVLQRLQQELNDVAETN